MSPQKSNPLEKIFETSLWNYRYIIMLAVIGLLLSSVIGFYLGIQSLVHATTGVIQNNSAEKIIVYLISALDEFLLGIILIIFAFGIYELFISKIDPLENDNAQGSKWLKFNTLEELKTVLVKVIIIILIVFFFKKVITMEFPRPQDILYLAGGIVLLAIAHYLSHHKGAEPTVQKEKSEK